MLIRHSLLPLEYKEWSLYVLESKAQCIIGLSAIILICTFIAAPIEIIALLFSLSLINSRSGGYHCSSFGRCFVLSLLTTTLSCLVAKVLSPYPGIPLILVGIASLLLLPAPVNNNAIHLSASELDNNKKRLRSNQIVIAFLVIITEIFKINYSIFLAQGYFVAAAANWVNYCSTKFGGAKKSETE